VEYSEVVPILGNPGRFIEELLEQRGWNQVILAMLLDMDNATVNRLIKNRRAIDAELAIRLEGVFGIPAEKFLEIQRAYDLAQARLWMKPDPERKLRAQIFSSFPISEMIERRWLPVSEMRDTEGIEASLKNFFHVPSIDAIQMLPHAAKRTASDSPPTTTQMAWIYRVRQLAKEMLVAQYSVDSAIVAIRDLKPLLVSAEASRKVPRIMAEAGIRFVIVESIGSSKIDGVCCWLDQHSPVIGMSLRFDRIDNFWFVLRHEMEHVMNSHGQNAPMLDAELEGERAGTGASVPEEERIANAAAAEFCARSSQMNAFISRKAPFFAERDILGFAKTLGVHPGLVAGQLQRRTGRYDLFRKHLVKIRSYVAPGALVDGWGDVAPVET
jgi:HTH-type transcriptional regulator/antitoxin HigA